MKEPKKYMDDLEAWGIVKRNVCVEDSPEKELLEEAMTIVEEALYQLDELKT